MPVDEEVGIVAVDAKRVRRGLRIGPFVGSKAGNRNVNGVEPPISRDRDPLLPAATREALEKLPEYRYRG